VTRRLEAPAAYRVCARITRSKAANFYYGIRLLPTDKRRALCAVYAFARRVDDVGDGVLPGNEKVRRLERIRRSVASLEPNGADPVLVALRDAGQRFPLPIRALSELVDGVEMDVRGTTYETFDDLLVYCRRVAGTIGRLSTAIFGPADPPRGDELSDDLGVAMQVTNILRDLREDVAFGRIYLPTEDRRRFGVDLRPFQILAEPDAALRDLVRFEAERAREWFARGLELLPLLDARSAACVAAMTGIYRRILERIDRDPGEIGRRRIALPVWEKAWVAARSLFGGRVSSARVPDRARITESP
jgi:phytoene synthase